MTIIKNETGHPSHDSPLNLNQRVQELRAQIIQIIKLHGATQPKLFGSLARGTAGPNSDLDILISLNAGRSLLDIIAIKQDLEDLLGCKVDVMTEAAISPYIRAQVLQEAVML